MSSQKEIVSIEGMSCGHCVAAVKSALSEIEGVETLDVTVGSATIDYDPEQVDREKIEGAIDDAGFSVTGYAVA